MISFASMLLNKRSQKRQKNCFFGYNYILTSGTTIVPLFHCRLGAVTVTTSAYHKAFIV